MGKTQPSNHKGRKPYNSYLKYANLGLQLILTIGLAGLLGYWIDKKLELNFPIFLLLLIFVSFFGSMYKLYREISK